MKTYVDEAIEINEETYDLILTRLRPCPKAPNVHRWGKAKTTQDLKLGDICDCSTWQVIEILEDNLIRCINAHGLTWEFYR